MQVFRIFIRFVILNVKRINESKKWLFKCFGDRLCFIHVKFYLCIYRTPIILKFWTEKLLIKLMPQSRSVWQFVSSCAICFYLNFNVEPKLLIITLCFHPFFGGLLILFYWIDFIFNHIWFLVPLKICPFMKIITLKYLVYFPA